MNPAKLLDWRKTLVYTHRWLGIAGTLFFISWFASGIVFLYADMPGLSADERLLRMAPVDLSTARVGPADAAATIVPRASRLRVAMFGSRPIYRFLSDSTWVGVYADTGEPIVPLSADAAVGVVERFLPGQRGIWHDALLDDSDQWSLYSDIRNQMPLHRIGVGDEASTYYYLTERTGDVIVKTTASGRRWAYASAVLHWLYFTPLRRHGQLWSDSIIWISLVGCVMCLSGLVWGIWRFSSRRRYRFKNERSVSPYAGMMRWHHYTGLIFGLFSSTWALSGALSLNPFAFLRSTPWTEAQIEAAPGGPIDLASVTLERLHASAATLSRMVPARELEYVQFQGQPYFLAYAPPNEHEPLPGMDGDVTAGLDASRDREHLIVSVLAPERGAFRQFNDAAMSAVARAAMPHAPVRDEVWLASYDDYYYARKISRPLPVLRVRFADAEGTWLYLDPQHGRIASRLETRDRWNRWLYHGLHSLDFPALYKRRPLWDIVVITLCLGGVGLSVTTFMPAIRRLRRRAGAFVPLANPVNTASGAASRPPASNRLSA